MWQSAESMCSGDKTTFKSTTVRRLFYLVFDTLKVSKLHWKLISSDPKHY